MTLIQVEEVLSRISYKPNWKVRLHWSHNPGRVTLNFASGPQPDSRKKGQIAHANLLKECYLDDIVDEKRLLWIVGNTLRDMEIHESWEWLRYKNRRLNDPHKGDKK
jgi:hypothetical protein